MWLLDDRFGASPDGVSCFEDVFLVEMKTRSLPNQKQLEKLTQGEQQVKIEALQIPLQHVSKNCFPSHYVFLMTFLTS